MKKYFRPILSLKTVKIAVALMSGLVWIFFSIPTMGNPGISPGKTNNKLGEYKDFSPDGDIRRFAGETLYFDISLLIFDNAVRAKVSFFEERGKFKSMLVAETKGFVGFFTSYRKHIYKSTFDIIEGGRRVRTAKFERKVIVGDDVERTIHYLDYHSRQHHWFKYSNETLKEQGSEPLPENVFFDDILAAFYNFRNGVYGKLNKGQNYTISTIPEKSMKNISAYINTDQEAAKFQEEEDNEMGGSLLLKVVIPKDVFKTETGELIFWTSNHFIPLETTVKNYILLGNLRAKFDKRIYKGSAMQTSLSSR